MTTSHLEINPLVKLESDQPVIFLQSQVSLTSNIFNCFLQRRMQPRIFFNGKMHFISHQQINIKCFKLNQIRSTLNSITNWLTSNSKLVNLMRFIQICWLISKIQQQKKQKKGFMTKIQGCLFLSQDKIFSLCTWIENLYLNLKYQIWIK